MYTIAAAAFQGSKVHEFMTVCIITSKTLLFWLFFIIWGWWIVGTLFDIILRNFRIPTNLFLSVLVGKKDFGVILASLSCSPKFFTLPYINLLQPIALVEELCVTWRLFEVFWFNQEWVCEKWKEGFYGYIFRFHENHLPLCKQKCEIRNKLFYSNKFPGCFSSFDCTNTIEWFFLNLLKTINLQVKKITYIAMLF